MRRSSSGRGSVSPTTVRSYSDRGCSQVVPDPCQLRRRRLVRPDVHAPVHHGRVHAHDLGVEGPGDLERQGGLARGGRADDRQHLAAHATSSPSRWWGAAAVMRTRANVPSRRASPGLGTWTSLLVRVRVVALPGSFLDGPSTSTSSSAPTWSRLRCSEIRSWAARSRSKRSWTTGFGIWSDRMPAAVPGRGEYWKV